jgi:hypothetical protein
MDLETFGYICLGIVGAAWLVALIAGVIEVLPFGLLGVVALLGFAALLVKVVRERRANEEDDYYAKNVKR